MFTINQYVENGERIGQWANKHLNATGLETRKGDGRDGEFSQCNRSPMDHCYTGFFNVRRGWQSLNTDLSFIYVSSEGQVGCEFIYPAQPTDSPSSRRSSRSHFYTLGFPRG